jgi:hypothetical protein
LADFFRGAPDFLADVVFLADVFLAEDVPRIRFAAVAVTRLAVFMAVGIPFAISFALAPAIPPTTAPTAAPIGPIMDPAAAPAAAPPTIPKPDAALASDFVRLLFAIVFPFVVFNSAPLLVCDLDLHARYARTSHRIGT